MSWTRRYSNDNQSLFAGETGSLKKKWKYKLPIALVFPNNYHLGMSNLGFQLIYGMLNDHPDIVCERFFYEVGQAPLSIESNRTLIEFKIILFSISFEQDFLGVIKILLAGNIDPVAKNRRAHSSLLHSGEPLVIGGGVATFINPEPLASIIDMFILGEIEPILPDFLATLFECTQSSDIFLTLRNASKALPGCYVPSLYSIDYNEDGTVLKARPEKSVPEKVVKNVNQDHSTAGHSRIISPNTEFSNIHLVELGRGCSKSCRFCAAGYVYRPPRSWPPKTIVNSLKARPPQGNRAGLLGMEMAKSTDLQEIASFFLHEECSLSFSSLRADIINGSLLELLAASKLKTAAIAPDGGSERLRKVINKGITATDCLKAASSLAKAGVNNLKLYFMIGLPTEEDEDLLELVELVRKIQNNLLEIGRKNKFFCKISLSINCFVPKAWTPFQYCGFTPVKELKRKIKLLRKQFSSFSNVKLSFDQPDHAYMQAMLSRGDRRVGDILLKICTLEKNWRQVCKDSNLDPAFYACRERSEDEVFPWDIVEHGINKSYLLSEYKLALKSRTSSGCEINLRKDCKKCGVCNG